MKDEELLSKYPFLREGLREFFGSNVSIKDFLEENEKYLREVSREILSILDSNDIRFDWETEKRVKKYIIAKILLTYIRDYFISARYAIKERKSLYDHLKIENDYGIILKIANELGITWNSKITAITSHFHHF